jgi:tetratricopeptide (TPR) repeat protein
MRLLKLIVVSIIVLFYTSCKISNKTGTRLAAKVHDTNQLSEKDRISFDNIFFNANKEEMLGNIDEAENLFSLCVRLDPGNATSIYELAKIYNSKSDKEDKEKALDLSGKAANLNQTNIWFQLLYADCLFSQKQFLKGTEIYQRIIKLNPEKIDMYFELADGYIYAGKPLEAVKVYDKIEEKIGVNEEGSLQKMKIYTQLRKSDKAINELKKLIQFNPREAKYYGMLGELYQNSGQKEKAMQAYEELKKIDPENPFVHLSLAQYYFEQKQDSKGLDEYKIAFGNPKLDMDTKIKILVAYFELSENKPAIKDDAMTLCKILIDTHPDEARAYSIYGKFLFRDKKLKEARDAFRMANARDKTRYDIWYQVLIIDSELNDFEGMLFDSKQTIELFPAAPLGYLFNGIANNQEKHYQPAVDVLKEGKDLVVGNTPGDTALLAQFYATLGDANHQLKNTQASDSAYEKALELDPKDVYVLNNYAYYLSLRKDKLEHAEAMSKKSVSIEPNNNSFLDTYGWILYQMGKYEEAKTWIAKALDNGAHSSAVILEHYGDILYKLGESEKAFEYWNNAKQNGGSSEFLEKKIADKKLYE